MQEPAQLRPCIGELLRTCVVPSSMKLRIEHIAKAHFQKDSDTAGPNLQDGVSGITRAYLSDLTLTIQAVLCQSSKEDSLVAGDVIDLTDFEVRKARRVQRHGHVVFLAVKGYVRAERKGPVDWTSEGGFVKDETASSPKLSGKRFKSPAQLIDMALNQQTGTYRPSAKRLRFEDIPSSSQLPRTSSPESSNSDQEDDDFETITPNPAATARRVEALRELHTVKLVPRKPARTTEDKVEHGGTLAVFSSHDIADHDSSHPPSLSNLPVHTLASLTHPYARLPKSYQCTVFGIITWASPNIIFKAPFPPKRHIKIHDISISAQHSGITLAVFVDAREFSPSVGTIALFRGVTMQKCGAEVILNAYKSLKDWNGEDWFVDDLEALRSLGWDVRGLHQWWENRQLQRRPSSRSSEKASDV